MARSIPSRATFSTLVRRNVPRVFRVDLARPRPMAWRNGGSGGTASSLKCLPGTLTGWNSIPLSIISEPDAVLDGCRLDMSSGRPRLRPRRDRDRGPRYLTACGALLLGHTPRRCRTRPQQARQATVADAGVPTDDHHFAQAGRRPGYRRVATCRSSTGTPPVAYVGIKCFNPVSASTERPARTRLGRRTRRAGGRCAIDHAYRPLWTNR